MSEDRRFGTGTTERKPLREEPSGEQVLAKNSIERLGVRPPATLIVGQVVSLGARLAWFEPHANAETEGAGIRAGPLDRGG